MKPWKEKVLAKAKETITGLKQKKTKQAKLILTDPDVKKHLEEVCEKFAIVTIDKASSNFAFICRKCYISKLLADVSPNKYKQVWLNARQHSNRKDFKISWIHGPRFEFDSRSFNYSMP